MKLCFKILFIFYVVLSLGFLDASNDSVILDGNAYDEVDGLLSDEKHGKQIGSDVELSGSGPINLTLTNEELVFQVCKDRCSAESTVCYESEIGLSDPDAAGTCFESSCKVKIEGKTDKITFGGALFYKKLFTGCLTSAMNHEFAKVISSDKSDHIKSCRPKIVGADKMVKLFVNIVDGCSVTVINAKIHEPQTTTMSATKVPPPTQSPSEDNSAEASSFPDWGYAVIGIALLIVILFIGFVVYYLYRKRQTSKLIPPNVDRKQQKSTKAKDATIETPTKKDDDVEAAKAEPKKSHKKEKKTKTVEPVEDVPEPAAKQNLEAAKVEPKKIQKEKKATQEPTTTEDAPTAKQPEPSPPKQLPRPNPAACSVRRLIPRGMKSAKTDSLDETLKIDKIAMIESTVVCAGNHCLEADESDVLNKMKADYPTNIQHDVLPSEVDLLCLPVSKMFKEMDSMARDSEQKLSDVGCEFDERHCIVSVSAEARQFLKNKTTDATTVYFAFGAEYHEYITDRSELSIPLLYVFALQPRFSETSRRKACATLRRQLVKVLGYYKCADRAKMPFPINIVEAAYCKDPKYFYEPSEIKTDSGRNGPKIKKNGGGKRKKKSTKKH